MEPDSFSIIYDIKKAQETCIYVKKDFMQSISQFMDDQLTQEPDISGLWITDAKKKLFSHYSLLTFLYFIHTNDPRCIDYPTLLQFQPLIEYFKLKELFLYGVVQVLIKHYDIQDLPLTNLTTHMVFEYINDPRHVEKLQTPLQGTPEMRIKFMKDALVKISL